MCRLLFTSTSEKLLSDIETHSQPSKFSNLVSIIIDIALILKNKQYSFSISEGFQVCRAVDMADKVNLLTAVLCYMDNHGILNTVKNVCKEYEQMEKCTFYSFVVEIDSIEFLNENPFLGNLLLNSPREATLLFQEILYRYITLVKLLSEDIKLNQISVVIRLISIPNIAGVYAIRTFCDLLAMPAKNRMITLQGVVIGMSALSKYTHHTIYACQIPECPGSSSKEFLRTYIPGATEAQIIQNNFCCFYCGLILEEMKPCRYLADKIITEVIPSWAFMDSENFRHQAILVYIRGDLIKKVSLGKEHQFFGIVRHDYQDSEILVTIDANNITNIPYEFSACDFKCLPNSLWDIFQKTAETPWRFASSLAFYFADKIVPPGSFWVLKLAILLNLVCSENETTDPLHLLVIGEESHIISQILLYSLRFCPRAIRHTANNYLTGKVTADSYCSAPYFVEAGSLLLASDGVCYLGDVSQHKKNTTERLRSILIEKKIKLEVGSKFTEGLPYLIEYPLKCRIWAFDSTNCKIAEKHDDLLSKSNFESRLVYLMDAFNFTVFTGPHENYKVMNHIFESYFDNNHTSSILDSDLLQLLTNLQAQEVSLTDESNLILKTYYIASRRARSISMDSSLVPVSALQVLAQITQSFAKLSLRRKATEPDAIMAIRLYEETLMMRFGMSVFDIHLSQQNYCNDIDTFLQSNDAAMINFFVQFKQCCTNFS